MSMFDKLDQVVKRFEELNDKLSDPSIYDRQSEFKEVSEERGNIEDDGTVILLLTLVNSAG